MHRYEILKQLCETSSVCGDEYELSEKIKTLLKPFNYELISQKSGNVIVHIKGSKGNRKIMLFTHIDESGLVINNIDERGFLNFKVLGDINIEDLASQEVNIRGRSELSGLIGLRPPHILTEKERMANVTISELNIDIGFDKDKSQELVPIGSTAVIKRRFDILRENLVTGRALCDKAGAAVLYDVIYKLKNMKDIKDDIYIVFGVQHYNNSRGALDAVNYIKPDIAIVIDYTEAKSRENSGVFNQCGFGPIIYRGPTAHSNLTENLLEYANNNNIKYGIKAGSGKNKTDAWTIQISCGGIPTLLMHYPVKYPHSFVEVMDIEDIFECSKLIAEYVSYLDSIDWSDLLCY